MPTYRYVKTKKVKSTDEVHLRIEFPKNEQGRAADHDIDLPGPKDKEGFHQCSISLGKGATLINNRVVVYSLVWNLREYDDVAIKYFIDINGEKSTKALVSHRNNVEEDISPQLKLTISFEKTS